MNLISFSDDYVDLEIDLYESVSNIPKVLGRMVGQYFVPNGVSRNNRFYSESLWKNTIESKRIKDKLAGGMLGTVLHPKTTEKDGALNLAHPMYASHVTRNLYIDDKNRGVGESYVLDTPMGRIVDTFSKSGLVQLFVSSRAYGKMGNQKVNGIPIIEENSYFLDTFDIVLDPGFLECKVGEGNLRESLEALSECYLDNINEITTMAKVEKESRASKLVRDMNLIIGKLK